jgi:hypothetical protein
MLLAASMTAGCTRTYDGSIVPAFSPVMINDGGMSRIALEETDTRPRNRYIYFPPAPARPPQAETVAASAPVRRGVRRVARRPADQGRPANAAPLRCSNQTGQGGRVRVVCE